VNLPTRVEEILGRHRLIGEQHQEIGAITDLVALIEERAEAARTETETTWNADLTAMARDLDTACEFLVDTIDRMSGSVSVEVTAFLDRVQPQDGGVPA